MLKIRRARTQDRRGRRDPFRHLGIQFHQGDVTWQDDDGNTADGALRYLGKLLRIEFDIVAVILEEVRMCRRE
jgi:hypothetical protein